MSLRQLSTLILLGAIWGASYIFINIVVQSIAPFFLMFSRVSLAGVGLLLYALWLRQVPSAKLRTMWKQFLVLGAINTGIPFTLIAFAQSNPDFTASLGAILNSTTPLLTAVVAAIFMEATLTIRKITGVILGIAGVAVLVGWSPIPLSEAVILSVVLSLLAALSYACGGVYAKMTFKDIRSVDMAIGQMFGAAAILLLPAATSIPAELPTIEIVLALLVLALVCTSFAYLLYFYLLRTAGPTKTLSVTFLVPVFAVLWGVLFLHEPLSLSLFVGLGIILLSVILVTEVHFLKTNNLHARKQKAKV